jgi:hypothetical protein
VGRDKPGPIRTKDGKSINGDGMPYDIFRSFLSGALNGRPARALRPAAHVGLTGKDDLRTLGRDLGRSPGLVYPGPQKGDLVDKSLATGTWDQRVARLTDALGKYGPDFSVSVVDRRTGKRFDYRGDQPFEAASVVKVELLAALLLDAQDAGRVLTATERTRVRKMIVASDNDAAVQVYAAVGGTAGLRRVLGRLGLDDTDPASAFGRTRTTANDQTRMVLALVAPDSPLNTGARELMLQLMSSVNADQTWGVSAASFAGEQTALKNGWLARSGEGGRWIVNSTGRVSGEKTDVALSVLSHGHDSQADGIAAVEQIAALTRSHLGW